jgi:hypothetical protein
MQLICEVWVESLNTRDDIRGKHTDRVKNIRLPLHYLLSTGRRFLGVSFITRINPNLCAGLTIHNTTENNCIISHAKTRWHFQPNTFLTLMHRLLVAGKGQSALPSVKHCQGQLQTQQPLTVGVTSVAGSGVSHEVGASALVLPNHHRFIQRYPNVSFLQ